MKIFTIKLNNKKM